MRCVSYCAKCGGGNFSFIDGTHFERGFCRDCNEEVDIRERYIETPYERTRRAVYATGNRWAIENFNATHN